VHTPRQAAASTEAPDEILRDLAVVLAQDQAVYLKLGPEGAVMSVKSGEKSFAFGEAIETRWRGMSPEKRAQAVHGWIRKAAKYCRNPRIRWEPA